MGTANVTVNPGLTGTPWQIVTLRDMLEFSLTAWIEISEALQTLQNPLSEPFLLGLTQDKERLIRPIQMIAKGCFELQLQHSYTFAAELLARLRRYTSATEKLSSFLERREEEQPRSELQKLYDSMRPESEQELTPDILKRAVETLRQRIMDELVNRVFLSVDPRMIPLYETLTPFGERVADHFPSALTDSQEASKCLALDRGTASVFHLMRVMEVGLKATALALGVEYTSDWGRCFRDIEKKGEQSDPFFKEAVAYLRSVKNVWRNPTMHIDRTYSGQEAERILNAVQSFMRHLSERLTE